MTPHRHRLPTIPIMTFVPKSRAINGGPGKLAGTDQKTTAGPDPDPEANAEANDQKPPHPPATSALIDDTRLCECCGLRHGGTSRYCDSCASAEYWN